MAVRVGTGALALGAVALAGVAALTYRTVTRKVRSDKAAPGSAAGAGSGAAAASSGAADAAGSKVMGAAAAWEVWARADAVCFDVDSTVTLDEGIDELAAHFGVGAAVAEYTASAMNGSVAFETALRARLELIKPTHSGVQEMLRVKPSRLSPGIKQLVSALHARGTHVFLISGGFRQLIAPIAEELGIPNDHVTANTILFDSTGEYAGFDASELTCRNGGKAAAVAHIIAHGTAHSATGAAEVKAAAVTGGSAFRTVVMVGDGITDVEARPPAALMIGYGGVKARPAVQAAADLFVRSFQPLIDALSAPAPASQPQPAQPPAVAASAADKSDGAKAAALLALTALAAATPVVLSVRKS